MSSRLPENHDVLRAFRLEIIRGLRVITLVVGTIGLFFSGYLALVNNNPAAAIGLLVLYLSTTVIFWAPGISELARLLSISVIAYLFSINALLNLGPLGSGRHWLIAFCAVSGAFLGFRAGVAAIIVATATYIVYAYAAATNLIALPPMVTMTTEMWIDQIIDIPLFALIVTLPGIYLITGLRKVYEHERTQRSELETANARLAVYNDDLQAFDYSVSNALRAPLRRLRGYLKLLEHEGVDGDPNRQTHFRVKVGQMAGEMDELLDGLMVLSRVNRKEMVRIWHDLGAMVGAIAQEYLEQEPERAVKVEIQPGIRIFADQFMCKQAITSLVDNAWKYTRTSRNPQLRIQIVEREGRRCLSFSDNGIGIKQEDRDAIFEPFHAYHTRGDFSTTGLGLPITRRIIERHGGMIHVEENEDDGATFILTLGPDNGWVEVVEETV